MNEEISNNIPDSLYKEYFTPDYNLHPEFVHKHDNANSKQYLEMITKTVYDNLKMVAFSPSVQMQDMIGMTRIDITTGPHSNSHFPKFWEQDFPKCQHSLILFDTYKLFLSLINYWAYFPNFCDLILYPWWLTKYVVFTDDLINWLWVSFGFELLYPFL